VIICGRRKDTLQEASNKFPSVITKSAIYLLKQKEMHSIIGFRKSQRLECACKQCWYSELDDCSDDDFYEKATAEITTNIVAPTSFDITL
jgi:uncharacterized oxidoreductase